MFLFPEFCPPSANPSPASDYREVNGVIVPTTRRAYGWEGDDKPNAANQRRSMQPLRPSNQGQAGKDHGKHQYRFANLISQRPQTYSGGVLHDLAHAGPDGMIADTLVAIAASHRKSALNPLGSPPSPR